MLIDILNKVLTLFFFLSLLTVIRHCYFFIQTWFLSSEEQPLKYIIDRNSLILLGISISYILTVILTGIKL